MTKSGVNTYKGMSSDASFDSINEGLYIEALDMRITTDKGESQGSITNIQGNKFFFELPTSDAEIGVSGTMEIIGTTSIRNTIIFFTADDTNTNGWIFTLEYSDVDQSIIGTPTIIYKSNELNFSKENPIEAEGRYETDCIQRVYFTDYEEYFRSVNIVDSTLLGTPVGLLDLFPNVIYVQPLLTRVLGGGAILSGNHQYAYRLSSFDGKETLISPPGNMIHAVADQESVIYTSRYNGNASGVNTGKAHEITIDTSNYQEFEKIELIHIHHSDYNGTPTIYSVETKNIANAAEVVFIHTDLEESIYELDLFDYTVKQYPFKTAKTLTEKDGSLVVANIKGTNFDVQSVLEELGETFDARTPRYDSSQNLPHPLVGSASEIEANKLKNAFNVNTSTSTSDDGYNMDAHWEADWHTDRQHKFQADGLRLGGEGPNISYTFSLEPYIIDDIYSANSPAALNSPVNTVNLNDGYGDYANTAFDGMASPFNSGLLRGNKRGEVYRTGIIFWNKKGESSFVEYIGDIKFPDISEEDSVTNDSGTNYFPVSRETTRTGTSQIVTTAYALGLEFTLDFSTCPQFLDTIEGYQIVRVKREDNDGRRLCSGITKNMMFTDIEDDANTTNSEFDLSVGNSTDVLHLYPYQQYRDENDIATQGLGNNSNFATLNKHLAESLEPNSFDIHGSFLTFYSPEISHKFGNTISNIVGTNACLLMTGRYGQYFSRINVSTAGETVTPPDNTFTDDKASYDVITTFDTTGTEGLGEKVTDHRKKMRTTAQVDKVTATATGTGYTTGQRGIEYVKQWVDNQHVNFNRGGFTTGENQADLSEGVIQYSGNDDDDAARNYYIRNFYAFIGNERVGLNWHKASAAPTTVHLSLFHKGASGITGTMERIGTDPYTGSPVSKIPYALDAFAPYVSGGGLGPVAALPEAGAPLNEGTLGEANLTSTPCIDILIPRAEIYGGYSQDALESNTFMPASPVISTSNAPGPSFTHTFKCYGGDVFINMWVFQASVGFIDERYYYFNVGGGSTANDFEDNMRENRTDTECFAVESRVNTDLSYGSTIKTGVVYTAPGGSSGIPHVQWRQETGNSTTDYGKILSMYEGAYYTAYSTESDDLAFFVKPANSDGVCNINDIRAYISNVKINAETIDSWTKFGINNFKDVDDYGPINKIINDKDEVYFFQDKAVGKYSINPRAITSTDDGIPTELGSAEGIQDFVYLSNRHGAIHQWGIVATDAGIYYWDGIHKKIFRMGSGQGGGNRPLSEMKGIHGFLKNLQGDVSLRKENGGDNPILDKGVHVTKDLVNNEVLFTFLGTWRAPNLEANVLYSQGEIIQHQGIHYTITETYTSFANGDADTLLSQLLNNATVTEKFPDSKLTLVFDEIANQFSSRFSATPPIYIENGDILLSSDPDNRNKVYRHNAGNYGEFYDNVEECFVKLVLNKEADVNKILRFIEFTSTVRDNNNNVITDQTITSFQVTTEYQDTGKTFFSTGRIKRKFGKWRLKIPRDKDTGGRNRLRSTHFVLTLYFDNTSNRELILNRIIHHFDIQMY